MRHFLNGRRDWSHTRIAGRYDERFRHWSDGSWGVQVDSTLPIYGLQIIGSLDRPSGNFLANIPAGIF
jgi:hypothetical protein